MEIISRVVERIARRGRVSCDRIGSRRNRDREQPVMSDEDFIIPGESQDRTPDGDDFEEMLEILIRIAQSEGREFLAYLLSMALIEARHHASPETHVPH